MPWSLEHGRLRSTEGLVSLHRLRLELYHTTRMAFPLKVCVVCSEEFELKPGKPGFANRCPACSEPDNEGSETKRSVDADERRSQTEADAARRRAIRDLLYRKDG